MAITLTWTFVTTTIGVAGSGQSVPAGDTVNFSTSSMVSGEYLYVYNLNNLTNNTAITRTSNGTTARTAGALGTDSVSWQGSVGGYLRTGTVSFTVINAQVIDLGQDLVYVRRYEYQELQGFTVASAGTVTTSVSGDASGQATCQVSVNGGAWTTSASVSVGNTVQVRVYPSTTYSDQITVTVSLAGTSDSCNVTTEPDPSVNIGEGSVINFGHATGAIPFGDVIYFFAGANISGVYTAPNSFSNYYRGGSYVPNITGNSGIPTSSTISLSQFRNAQTVLYFVRKPATKGATRNTISSGGQVVVAWYAFDTPWGNPADWEMGYGAYMKWATEYQYSLTVTSFVVNAGGYTVYPRLTAATPTTWTAASGWSTAGQVGFGVEMYVNQNSEIFAEGYITMQVRHPNNTSNTLSHNVYWSLRCFGP